MQERNNFGQLQNQEENNQNQSYYLSSLDLDEKYEQKHNFYFEEEKPQSRQVVNIFYFLFLLVLQFISYIFFIVPIVIPVFMYRAAKALFACLDCRNAILCLLFAVVCSSSTLYALIIYFTSWINYQYSSVCLIYNNIIFFYLTTIMIQAYIKTVHISSLSLIDAMFSLINNKSINTVQCQGFEEVIENAYLLDYKIIREMPKIAKETEISNFSQDFSNFKMQKQLPSLNISSFSLLYGFDNNYIPNLKQFTILASLIAIQLYFAQLYSHQDSELNQRDFIALCIFAFFYIYTVWNLHRILGRFLEKVRGFNETSSKTTLDEKIDITCPVSLEAWDKLRKFVLRYEHKHLLTLELVYLFLFIYFIFSLLIILSCYFEYYWIIPRESIYLHPINLIMNTFNFILLSCYQLFRIYEGNKYNDEIDNIYLAISNNLNAAEDVYTMFNKLIFIDKKQRDKKSDGILYDRKSAQALIIKRIKLVSKCYIQDKIKYYGVVYEKNQKDLLRKKMIKNTLVSLKKVRESVQNDTETFKYKFLNLLEINYNYLLITFIIVIAIFLPRIISLFSVLFTKKYQ